MIHPHAVGSLLAMVKGKVVDLDTGVRLGPGEPGQLCFKTDSIMKGYFDMVGVEKKEVINQWFHTGDFG